MFKKIITLMLTVAILFLASCSQTINLRCESTSWRGTYNVNVMDNNKEVGEYTFTYKGPSSQNLEIDELTIENGSSSTQLMNRPLDRGMIKIPVSCSGCNKRNKENPIKVSISWGDNTESFELIQ